MTGATACVDCGADTYDGVGLQNASVAIQGYRMGELELHVQQRLLGA